MKILLPDHSEKCHSITVHNGARYIEEHLMTRTPKGDYLDVTAYEGDDIRLEHSPADVRGTKQPPQYRAIARLDGIWYPYDITAPAWGLPVLAKAETKPEITDLHPADGLDSDCQDDTQSEGETPAESLTPAKEKKSRTSR
jgi:hypothetical protein